MKRCSKCLETKPEVEYFIKEKTSGRLHAQCKDCYRKHRKTYQAQHYQKYGESYRERARVRKKIIKTELRANMLKYLKDKSCTVCGEKDIRTLEFDHLDPSKKLFGIAKVITDGRQWESIVKEIQKCRILCANCHKKHTSEVVGWYKNAN